ncbi:hypothetical protein [Streptomyces sp. NPDC059928]|uniref:hypothetical protein n=1 Tax=unclassified Streptomyces TaxID=2593676 RepID=UPI003648589F
MTSTTMILNAFGLVGIAATVLGGYVVLRATNEAKTAEVWRGEAEAQKARADRLQDDLTEIKQRLTSIERENQRLIEVLTALDPARLASFPHDN